MESPPLLCFPPFRLDLRNEQLWREHQEIPLRPKTFAVLRHLVEHAQQLVTKEALLNAVWPKTIVSDVVLMSCIRDLRKVFGDDARTSRFIQTMHRRGYRFIAPLSSSPSASHATLNLARQAAAKPTQDARAHTEQREAPNQQLATPFVGRAVERAHLHKLLVKSLNGKRQFAFLTGEPGIGKTALIDTFLEGMRQWEFGADSSPLHKREPTSQIPNPGIWVARGQCIEQHGAGEAFLPILDALGRLCRSSHREQVLSVLRHYAPSWLVHLPSCITPDECARLQHTVDHASRERMLREGAEALETLTAEAPLVLLLEDLHWSDVSTLDLLAFLARRREPARVLVLGTYRPVQMLGDGHPLKGITQELYGQRLAVEVSLEGLSESAVHQYVAARLSGLVHLRKEGQTERKEERQHQQLSHWLFERTGGNPLFLVSMVDDLFERGIFAQTDTGCEFTGNVHELAHLVPDNIRHLVTRQSERLSVEAQQLLEAASVAGMAFSAAAISAALATDTATIERSCEQLVQRHQFLTRCGIEEWPDGTLAARYGFRHALYQQLWHERVSPTQRQHHHLHLAERMERAYGERAHEIAAELAMHFAHGREYRKAIHYLQQAGTNASHRSAHHEALALFGQGLELLKKLPHATEQTQMELTLQMALAHQLSAVKGEGAPEVGETFTRAVALSQQVGERSQLFAAVSGLWLFALNRGELQSAHELAEQLLRLAQQTKDAPLLLSAQRNYGVTLHYLGEGASAYAHLEQAFALYDPQLYRAMAFHSGQDPGVLCLSYMSWILWFLGYPEQALTRSHEALTLAYEMARPYNIATALVFAATVHQCRGEVHQTRERAEAAITLSTTHGFRQWLGIATALRGWALVEQGDRQEGMAQIRDSRVRNIHVLLAEACRQTGQFAEGLAVLAKAITTADKTGARVGQAEYYRLMGELTLQKEAKGWEHGVRSVSQAIRPKAPIPSGVVAEAEGYFLKAIAIAQQQHAKSWELRATTSLARLWHQRGKRQQAHHMLSAVYHWFTEGFETKDVQDAQGFLHHLARGESRR